SRVSQAALVPNKHQEICKGKVPTGRRTAAWSACLGGARAGCQTDEGPSLRMRKVQKKVPQIPYIRRHMRQL
ncbi:MAG: hypothetical protein ACK56I_23840, partial [bacterium]